MSNLLTSQPDTYVLSIAISDYNDLDKLPNAVNDADEIIDILYKKYKIKNHWSLHNSKANSYSIKNTFSEIKDAAKQDDALLILYNGHGSINGSEIPYWQFSNSHRNKTDTWYKCADIFHEIERLKIKDIALIVNSCFSGNLIDSFNHSRYDKGGDNTRILLTAGSKNEPVQEAINHYGFSPFSKTVIDFLKNNKDNYEVPLLRLSSYVQSKFREQNYGSTPKLTFFPGHEKGDFIFHLNRSRADIWRETKQKDTIEAYDDFLQEFQEGLYVQEAEDRRRELVDEKNRWFNILEEFYDNINRFQNGQKISKNISLKIDKIFKQVEDFKTDTNQSINDYAEWNKIRTILNSKKTRSEMIKAVGDFIDKNPDHIQTPQAKQTLKRLEKKQEETTLWNSILTNLRISPENRKNRIIAYTDEYPYTHNEKAGEKLIEISLFIDAESLFEERKIDEAESLYKKYREDFPRGDYKPRVNKRLQKIENIRRSEKRRSAYNIILEEDDIPKIYQLVNEIEGLTEDERKVNEIVLSKAKSKIVDYKKVRKEAFDKAIGSDLVSLLKEFISKYENCEHSKDEVEKVRNKLSDKEEASYNYAEKSKDLEVFREHRSQFGETPKVNARIQELEFYQSLDTKEHLEKYVEIYKENGLMVQEAQEQIKCFNYDEQKSQAYTQAKNAESIELCDTYLEEYKSDKDQYYEAIKVKRKELDKQKRSNELFEQIKKATGKDVLKLCENFKSDFAESNLIPEVQKIEDDTKRNIEDDEDFEKAKKDKTINGVLAYRDKYKDKGRHSLEVNKMLKRSDEKDVEKEALTKKYKRLVRIVIVVMATLAVSGGIMLFQYFQNVN